MRTQLLAAEAAAGSARTTIAERSFDPQASAIPSDPRAMLLRKQAAEALTEAGFPTSWRTLQGMATRGGGPPYYLYGFRTLYRWNEVLAWAERKAAAHRRGGPSTPPEPAEAAPPARRRGRS